MQAQKIYGNRWTEIAKVVSGRTDNAVKNRFSTLCKKRAKREALTKENNAPYIKANNRTMIHGKNTTGALETSMPPMKMRRKHITDTTEDSDLERLLGDCRTTSQQPRLPLAVLPQKSHNINALTAQFHASGNKEVPKDASGNIVEGTFLKKDDPKIIALMQQAELLNSLALRVNTEKTDQSFENAWKVVQDFLKRDKESDVLGFDISDINFQLENFKDLVEEICNEGSQQSWRQPGLYPGSPDNSSTGSTFFSQISEKMELPVDNLGKSIIASDAARNQDTLLSCDEFKNDVGAGCPLPNSEFNSPLEVTLSCDEFKNDVGAGCPLPNSEFNSPVEVTVSCDEFKNDFGAVCNLRNPRFNSQVDVTVSCDEISNDVGTGCHLRNSEFNSRPQVTISFDEFKTDVGAGCPLPNSEFNSPLQVTPLFRSMAAGIPSPQFSESEKHFLLKTLGMESTAPNPSSRTAQPPPCKRALLHCL